MNQTGGTLNTQSFTIPRMNNGIVKNQVGNYEMKLEDFETGNVYHYTISPPDFQLYEITEAVPATPTFFKFTTT